MPTPLLVRVDAYDEQKSLLLPFVARRVREHARRVDPALADAVTVGAMQGAVLRDPSVLLLAVYDRETNTVVGHLLAHGVQAAEPTVLVKQYHTDPGNWGDVTERMIAEVEAWAGNAKVRWETTQRDGGTLVKKHGYKVTRYVLERETGSVKSGTNGHAG